jgi:hypothetical protein
LANLQTLLDLLAPREPSGWPINVESAEYLVGEGGSSVQTKVVGPTLSNRREKLMIVGEVVHRK